MPVVPGSVRSSMIESEWRSRRARRRCRVVGAEQQDRRRLESRRPSCFASARASPARRRLFAAATPLRTRGSSRALQTTTRIRKRPRARSERHAGRAGAAVGGGARRAPSPRAPAEALRRPGRAGSGTSLGAAAAVDAVRLLLRGHPAGYGSPPWRASASSASTWAARRSSPASSTATGRVDARERRDPAGVAGGAPAGLDAAVAS